MERREHDLATPTVSAVAKLLAQIGERWQAVPGANQVVATRLPSCRLHPGSAGLVAMPDKCV
jgi:hypothetical protein